MTCIRWLAYTWYPVTKTNNLHKLLTHLTVYRITYILNHIYRPEEYKKKVSEYVRKYASEEALRQAEATAVSSSSESSMSDFSEDEAQVKFQLLNEVFECIVILNLVWTFIAIFEMLRAPYIVNIHTEILFRTIL